jgi:hypothetical protein
MPYEEAKRVLREAAMAERPQAIREALRMGMPLREIEEFLDQLDDSRDGRGRDVHPTKDTTEGSASRPE